MIAERCVRRWKGNVQVLKLAKKPAGFGFVLDTPPPTPLINHQYPALLSTRFHTGASSFSLPSFPSFPPAYASRCFSKVAKESS